MKTSVSQTFNKHWIHRTFLILNKIQGCIIFSSNFETKFRKHSKLQTISRHSLISRQFYQTYQPCYVCMCVGRSVLCACVSVGLPCVCMYVGRSASCVSVGLPCVCMCVGRSALCVHVCWSVCLVCWSVCLVCWSVCLVCWCRLCKLCKFI